LKTPLVAGDLSTITEVLADAATITRLIYSNDYSELMWMYLMYLTINLSEKTTLRPGMAGRAGRFNLDQQRIAVAIIKKGNNALRVAAACPLVP
jgi:hypothetical protein